MRPMIPLLIALASLANARTGWSKDVTVPRELRAILTERCLDCHNADKKKGKFDMEALLAAPDAPKTWLAVYDEVESGNMPPEDKPALKPAEKLTLLKNIPAFQEGRRSRLLTPTEINNCAKYMSSSTCPGR